MYWFWVLFSLWSTLSKVLKLAPLQPSIYWLHCYCFLDHLLSPLYSHLLLLHFAVDLLFYSKGTEPLLFILFKAAPIQKHPMHDAAVIKHTNSHDSGTHVLQLVIKVLHQYQAEIKYIAVTNIYKELFDLKSC